MAKKRKSHRYSTVRERFLFYVDKLFADNQRRTAEYLGCSQAVISKIKLGKQNPGGRVLDQLTQHPKVNPAWLMQGEGEPLLAERKTGHDGGWPVPIAETILPGPPASHTEMLTDRMELVSGAVYRDTAYIVAVTPDLQDDAEGIRSGDRILLDANPRRWRSNLRVLNRKLCAVRRNTTAGPQIELRRVHCAFAEDGDDVQLQIATRLEPDIDKEIGKERRPIEPDKPARRGKKQKAGKAIVLDDIVAIAVQLLRDL